MNLVKGNCVTNIFFLNIRHQKGLMMDIQMM